MKLYIDDIRYPVIHDEDSEDWIIARNYDEAIEILSNPNALSSISLISFDHDLGENSKTGYDIVCWIERRVATGEWTTVPAMFIHSANPVGRANMRAGIMSILNYIAWG